jgi:beta-lactam-binding protein with PASTA domain
VAIRKILSAFGKLGIVALIAVAFVFGMLVTIYYSLKSPNIQVPDVVSKSYLDGEKTLGKAGLDIRERAQRYKPDVAPGVILDQSPHAGEIVKAGQTIAVVVSRSAKEGERPPDEAVAQERRGERGTEGLDENRNQNTNRRKNTNKNANANGNASANTSLNANGETTNANAHNKNTENTNLSVNRSTNANVSGNRNRNANTGARNSNSAAPRTGRPSNSNRRPNP